LNTTEPEPRPTPPIEANKKILPEESFPQTDLPDLTQE
jgi:hypothetical protein